MTATENKFVEFKNLTDSQQESFINKYRDIHVADSNFWSECVIDDAKEITSLMGIEVDKVYFSGFSSQGDGACFTGNFSYVKNMVKNVKNYAHGPDDEELHKIAKYMQELHRKAFYGLTGSISHYGHYYHERSMRVSYDLEKGSLDEDYLLDVLGYFAHWIYRNLEKEYDYLTSDECIIEYLSNEEWEIDEEGELV